MIRVLGGSEEKFQPVLNASDRARSELADRFFEICFVYCEDLGDVHYARAWQSAFTFSEADVSRRAGAIQVRRDQTDDGGCNPAGVKDIVLNYNAGVTFGWLGGSRWPEV